MRKKILHIGLGKCGSTFLQKSIFPEIEKKTKIKFFTMNESNLCQNNGYNLHQ